MNYSEMSIAKFHSMDPSLRIRRYISGSRFELQVARRKCSISRALGRGPQQFLGTTTLVEAPDFRVIFEVRVDRSHRTSGVITVCPLPLSTQNEGTNCAQSLYQLRMSERIS